MEQTIPSLILAAAMIMTSLVVAGAARTYWSSTAPSLKEAVATAEQRLGTELSVTDKSLNAGGDRVTVTLENRGRTPIADPRLMDLMVSYTDQAGQRHSSWYPYADGPLQQNTWTITAIQGDRRNPGMVDPGETMVLEVWLDPPVDTANTDRWLVVSTPSGLSYTVYF
ncbi:hypothetical protein HRbin25_00272 [bacterium HR25]|jgi:hypothetical protein|nr:hypothetical protein HRbin25_00272 [bacterium HR25]